MKIEEEEWPEIIDEINRRYNKSYENKLEMLKGMLLDFGVLRSSDILGISHHDFREALIEEGYIPGRDYTRWDLIVEKLGFCGTVEEYLEDRRKRYRSLVLIAREVGCSRTTVLNKFNSLRLKIPPHGGDRTKGVLRMRGKTVEEAFLEIPDEKLAKMRGKDIAKMLNCTEEHVSLIALRHYPFKKTGIKHKKKSLEARGYLS